MLRSLLAAQGVAFLFKHVQPALEPVEKLRVGGGLGHQRDDLLGHLLPLAAGEHPAHQVFAVLRWMKE